MSAEDKLNRHKAEKLTNEANELRDKKDYEKAIEKYIAAQTADPTYDYAYTGLSLLYCSLDDYEEAANAIRKALDLKVETARLHEYLGDALCKHKKFDEALQCYNRALELEPKRSLVYSSIALLYWEQENEDKCEEFARKALAIDPQNTQGLGLLGSIAEKRGNLEDALKYFLAANRTWSMGNVQKKIRARDQWSILPTVTDMLCYLNRFVCGQERAKIDLATAIYNHYISNSWKDDNILNTDLGRYNILVFGPSGCGKTYMIELLTKKLGIPLAIISAPSLVQTGYVGKKVDSIVEDLLAAAEFDVAKAERGIIFVDEIDKVRCHSGSGVDVSGEGVQNGLLTLLEGRPVCVEGRAGKTYVVDTTKVLFICAGAFDGITKIVQRRLSKIGGSLGFGSAVHQKGDLDESQLLDLVNVEDLEKFGMLSQIIGRFTTTTHLNMLTRDDLKKILTSMENSVLSKQRKLFELHGIELDICTEAIEAMLDLTSSAKTGARGLRGAMSKALQGISWRLDQLALQKVSKIRVTRQTVISQADPEFAHRGDEDVSNTGEAARLRSLAFVAKKERTSAAAKPSSKTN